MTDKILSMEEVSLFADLNNMKFVDALYRLYELKHQCCVVQSERCKKLQMLMGERDGENTSS